MLKNNFQLYWVFGRLALGRVLGEGCIPDMATACCIGTEQFGAN